MTQLLIPQTSVKMASGAEVDPDVLVGYRPDRTIKNRTLVIGRGARLRSGTVLYAGSRIGKDLETGHHVVVREENRIGDHVRLWNGVTIDYGCRIGNRVKIHCNCYVAQYSTLGDDVFLAPGVTLANDLYPGHPKSAAKLRGPTLARGVQLGGHVTVLPYVRIGEGTLVGAGSVVTRDLPAGVVAWGNPARVHKRVAQLTVEERLSSLRKRTPRWP